MFPTPGRSMAPGATTSVSPQNIDTTVGYRQAVVVAALATSLTAHTSTT